CGPAHVADYLRQRGVDTVGVDVSAAMAAVARERRPRLPFVVADMRQLPFAPASVAGIVAFYSVIHLPRPYVPAALAELRRVLQPGAPLLIAVHGGAGIIRKEEFVGVPVSV